MLNGLSLLDDSLKILLETNAKYKILVEFDNHKITNLKKPETIKIAKTTDDIRKELENILS